MVKNPACGMTVANPEALQPGRDQQNTICSCSAIGKESSGRKIGAEKPTVKKGIFARFLEKLAKENEKSFGSKPPTCH